MVPFRSALCGLLVCVATSAHALGFGTPLDDPNVCGNPEVATTLADPDTFTNESSQKDCLSWCKKTVASCERLVGRVYACKQTFTQDDNKFAARTCDHAEGDARRVCFAASKETLRNLKAALKAARSLDLQGCADWGAQCTTACNESSF